MRKVLLIAVIALAVAGAAWLAWRVRSERSASTPVLMLQVSGTTEETFLQGNPFIFTVYLSGARPSPSLRVGAPGRSWHSHLNLESTDPRQPLSWTAVPLGSPVLSSFEGAASGELQPEKEGGDEAVVNSDRLYELELGVDPEAAARIPEGRYTVRAVLEIPFAPPWRWSGRVVSEPVIVTVVREGALIPPDLERKRLVESVEFNLRARRFQDAYNLALQLQEREPEEIYTHLLLGDALNGLKRDQEALDAYEYALLLSSLEPRREPPEYLLGRKYEVQQRLGLRQ